MSEAPRIDRIENRLIVGRRFEEIVDELTLSGTTMPRDGTVPQISEGKQVFSFSYTPKKIGNLITIHSNIVLFDSVNSNPIYALWLFGNADAVKGGLNGLASIALRGTLYSLHHELTVASLTPMAVETRWGATGASTTTMNRQLTEGANPSWGGIVGSSIILEELEIPPV